MYTYDGLTLNERNAQRQHLAASRKADRKRAKLDRDWRAFLRECSKATRS